LRFVGSKTNRLDHEGRHKIGAMEVDYADPAVAAFVLIPVALVGVLVWATAATWQRGGAPPDVARRAAVIVGGAALAWMAVTWTAASSGVLRLWERTPPPFGVLVVGILLLGVIIAFSRLGRQLALHVPLWGLVAVQAFRLPLELAMHVMYERGIMPGEMTYTGRNFDIVTGATAIVVAAMVGTGRAGRGVVAIWNVMGLALLVNVVTVAILATPRFRYFGDGSLNTWVTYPPFVWLPAVMVLAALAGHLVIFRALRSPIYR
jgi:hypothetical protein